MALTFCNGWLQNRGGSWVFSRNLPVGQFYKIAVDDQGLPQLRPRGLWTVEFTEGA